MKFNALDIIDIPELIQGCKKRHQNIPFCEVHDCVVRSGVIHGEFHWHKHDAEGDFFYVINGLLHVDIQNKTVNLRSGQGIIVLRAANHRIKALERTAVMMIESWTVTSIEN
ncbi:MAG: cupin domain-containing protein [Candidatus Thorarchaeota archaeon]|nr:cupin domain-containing protein [Candidatus Thorarchaeota archaeon]